MHTEDLKGGILMPGDVAYYLYPPLKTQIAAEICKRRFSTSQAHVVDRLPIGGTLSHTHFVPHTLKKYPHQTAQSYL